MLSTWITCSCSPQSNPLCHDYSESRDARCRFPETGCTMRYRSALEETFSSALPCVQWLSGACVYIADMLLQDLFCSLYVLKVLQPHQAGCLQPSHTIHMSISYTSFVSIAAQFPSKWPLHPLKTFPSFSKQFKAWGLLKPTMGACQQCQHKQRSRCAAGSRREAVGREALAAEQHGGDGSCKADGLSTASHRGEGSPF